MFIVHTVLIFFPNVLQRLLKLFGNNIHFLKTQCWRRKKTKFFFKKVVAGGGILMPYN